MTETTTYIIMGVCLLITGFANFMSRRPRPLGRAWSVPWNGVQFVALLVLLLMFRHLITLHTGNDGQLMRP